MPWVFEDKLNYTWAAGISHQGVKMIWLQKQLKTNTL